MHYTIKDRATKLISDNQETYVAQWILSNPDKNIDDYTLCHQNLFEGENYITKFWVEKKGTLMGE